MERSWTDLLYLAGWEFARPNPTKTLAFVYAATVGLGVEGWCAGLNPNLPFGVLHHALTKEPDWVGRRKEWLTAGWPQREATTKADSELFGLIRSKAHLALGSKIPDGTAIEMFEALAQMFPEVIVKPPSNSSAYQAWNATVTVDTEGGTSCGWQIAREGDPLPRANETIGNRRVRNSSL